MSYQDESLLSVYFYITFVQNAISFRQLIFKNLSKGNYKIVNTLTLCKQITNIIIKITHKMKFDVYMIYMLKKRFYC